MNFLKIHFFSIIRVLKPIYNCQVLLLAPADLSVCPRHMWRVMVRDAADAVRAASLRVRAQNGNETPCPPKRGKLRISR